MLPENRRKLPVQDSPPATTSWRRMAPMASRTGDQSRPMKAATSSPTPPRSIPRERTKSVPTYLIGQAIGKNPRLRVQPSPSPRLLIQLLLQQKSQRQNQLKSRPIRQRLNQLSNLQQQQNRRMSQPQQPSQPIRPRTNRQQRTSQPILQLLNPLSNLPQQ